MILQYFKKKENKYKDIADKIYLSILSKSKELIFLITPRIYSEFSAHPHNQMKIKFKENGSVKPTGYTFVDEQTQKDQLLEFKKRSKL